MTRIETKIVRKPIKMTALSFAVAQAAMVWGGAAHAQTEPAGDQSAQTVVVTGQRAAMQSAAKLKQYSDEVIDAVGMSGGWRPFPLVTWTGSEFSLLEPT